MHQSPALYARGPYRVVAHAEEPARPGARTYAVVDTAGVVLHDEPTLEAACDWVDRRIADAVPLEPASRRASYRRRAP